MAGNNRSRGATRSGGVLVLVLASLIVLFLFLAAIADRAVSDHRRMQDGQWREQAVWLAESAFSRARWQLHRNPDFAGETWELPAPLGPAASRLQIVIQTTADPAREDRRLVRVDVVDPRGTGRHVLISQERSITFPEPGRSS